MPPAISDGPGLPTNGPLTYAFNVRCLPPLNDAAQLLEFTLDAVAVNTLSQHGGRFDIVRQPLVGAEEPIFSVELPEQLAVVSDPGMSNYMFIGFATIDLTLGNAFFSDWNQRRGNGTFEVPVRISYPPESVHE